MPAKRVTSSEFDVGARLKSIRDQHGLSQRELADRAGVPHGQIGMIEKNRSSPSVASLRRILSGISMTMAEFFEPDSPVRRQPRVFFAPRDLLDLTGKLSQHGGGSSRGKLSLRQVGDAHEHNLQILHETYAPGADTGESMLEHDSSEGGVVISGELEVTVGADVRILKAGDAYLFSSRKRHRFRNAGKQPAVVVSACTPPYL